MAWKCSYKLNVLAVLIALGVAASAGVYTISSYNAAKGAQYQATLANELALLMFCASFAVSSSSDGIFEAERCC
jgi:hypothetical protein